MLGALWGLDVFLMFNGMVQDKVMCLWFSEEEVEITQEHAVVIVELFFYNNPEIFLF